MEIRRPWLLVVLPAVASVVGFVLKILLTVGESRDVGSSAILGAVVGLAAALLLTVRRRPIAKR